MDASDQACFLDANSLFLNPVDRKDHKKKTNKMLEEQQIQVDLANV